MNFRKLITYSYLVAFIIPSINAAFLNCSPVKALEEITDGSKPKNPFSSQYNLVSHTNDPPHLKKQLQAKQRFNLLSEKEYVSPDSMNKKRNFKEAFEKGEVRPKLKELSDNIKEPTFSSPLFPDWGDDLMFFATEWDVFPTYLMEPSAAGTQHNFGIALDGSERDYHDYYPNDFFWAENNLEFMPQPEYLSTINRIDFNEAAESQLPEKFHFGESIITEKLPLNSLIEDDPPAGLSENSYRVAEKNVGLNLHGEVGELDKEKQSSNKIYENPYSIHFDKNPDIPHETTTGKPQKNIIEISDLSIIEKNSGKKNKLEEKNIPQSSQSSSNLYEEQIEMTSQNAKSQLVNENKKFKKFSFLEQKFDDAINEFKVKLQGLSDPRSSKSSISLFFETLDNYADNISTRHYPKIRKVKNPKDSKIYSHNNFIKRFLGHSEISISRSLLEEMGNNFEKRRNKGSKLSNPFFDILINDQIILNGDENFYILDNQMKLFFDSNNSNFRVNSLILDNVPKNRNYYADRLANTFYKGTESIPWEAISTSDNKLKLFAKREFILKEKRTKKFDIHYGVLQNQRFILRKLFLVYSTLMNKIFCTGKKDLRKNFLGRQKAAMDYFDLLLGLIEIDSKETKNYFIRNENLPLSEDVKKIFTDKISTAKFQFRLFNGSRNKIDVTWKFLALWLANDKFNYYKEAYLTADNEAFNVKQFFNSLFFYILES